MHVTTCLPSTAALFWKKRAPRSMRESTRKGHVPTRGRQEEDKKDDAAEELQASCKMSSSDAPAASTASAVGADDVAVLREFAAFWI